MSFDNPGILVFLLLLVVFIPIVIVRHIRNREKAALFAAAAPPTKREPLLRELRLRIIVSDIFFLFFVGLLVVALAGPRWGLRIVSDYRRGVDMVLAFDLSRSMNVRDCPPHHFIEPENSSESERTSRIERSMGIAQELVASLGDIRMGTAIGKGRGVLAVPLTYDSEMIMNFLLVLDSQAVTGRGTDLESLIDAALGAFQESIPSSRGIILFSDGEILSGSFQRAVDKTRRIGATLSVVGLGSDSGGPIPVERGPDAAGRGTLDTFLYGSDGKLVISARQVDALQMGAERTGGVYVDGNRDDAAQILAGYINSLSSETRFQGQRREANPQWWLFVLAAIACLGIVRLMGFSRRSRRRGVISALLCLLLLSSCAKSQGRLLIMEANFFQTRAYYTEAMASYLKALNYNDAAPYAEFGLASAFFALEEGEAALDRYREAERFLALRREDHPELKYRIYYNMGIIYFENGEYEEALRSFRDALKIDGSRIEAKRNLELSLLSIARSNPSQAASSQELEDDGKGSGEGSSVLFEYLKAKEQEQWKSREWAGENDYSGPDY